MPFALTTFKAVDILIVELPDRMMVFPMSSGNDQKRRLREKMLLKRKALPPANRVIHSATILQRLFELNPMRGALWVKFYASYGSEVETHGMIAHALMSGKRIAVPKVDRGG